MKKFVSALLCLAIILSLCSCAAKDDTAFVMGVTEQPVTFDPRYAENLTEKMISANCFDGLLRFDSEGKINLAGATGYTIGKDGLSYTFKLNPNACFYLSPAIKANIEAFGMEKFRKKITAQDYIYGIEKFREANPSVLSSLKSVTSVDDYTLEFTLNNADVDFLYKLASYPIFPCREEFYKKAESIYGTTPATILTNGPYYIESSGKFETVISKNPDYNGNIQVKNKQVTFYTTGKTENFEERLSNGSYDLYSSQNVKVTNDDISSYSSVNAVWGLLFNCKSEYAQKNIRKALSGTVNYTEIKAPDFSHGKTDSIIPGEFCVVDTRYSDFTTEPFSYTADIQKAKKNIEAALKKSKKETLTLKFAVPEGFKEEATKITDNWASLFGTSLTFEINVFSLKDTEKIISDGKYDIGILPLQQNNNTAYDILKSVETSPCGYESEKLQKKLNSVSNVASESITDYKKIETQIIENGVFTPIFTTNTVVLLNNNVNGIYIADGGNAIYFHGGTKN